MDFFAHQEAARRDSRRLIWVMALAVLAVVLAVSFTALLCFNANNDLAIRELRGPILIWSSLLTLAVIVIGSLIAWFGIRGGGRSVAESLGGRELLHERADPDERRLLNIVEEMSIASGVPRPPVFLLEEDGINAFAAGFTPTDAAIGVTRGAVRQLSRDELQGVIGHEFSHVLNGDMRLNMRLIAMIAGLLVLSQVGLFVIRAILHGGFSSSSNRKGKGGGAFPILLFAVGLFLIGLFGWVVGRLVQAAFSRKREFLADASAVQFTRNPGGIAGALRRIASGASSVAAERAPGMAHMFFANALTSQISSMLATHPPLPDRIARIEGVPVTAIAVDSGPTSSSPAAMGFARSGIPAAQAVSLSGVMSPDRVRLGAELLSRMPAVLAQAAREPVSARAASLLPLLSAKSGDADRQVALLHARDPWLASEIRRLQPHWQSLDADRARWPLLKLTAPALGAMSVRQRKEHLALAEALAAEDRVLTFREFCALRTLRRTLGNVAHSTQRARLRDVAAEVGLILDALATCGSNDTACQDKAFAAGMLRLPIPGTKPQRPSASDCKLDRLGLALDRVSGLDAAGLRAVTDACAHTVAADGAITPRESELLRLVCDEFGVPLPPFAEVLNQ
ncbi:MAG: M48 family metallopeptidase [Planctomycetota bacterium]